ncbi:MAG: permease prefix domain 1-containing protein [Defluviitaleaceae bacterium]|nr:permease prefix domain 1-containing protein [Defluviitaleaceae bacterium]
MNNVRIIEWVDSLFADVEQTDNVLDQKEELQMHLTDRIKDHMANGANFDEAFHLATADLGDVDELIAGFRQDGDKVSVKRENRKNRDYGDEWDDDDDEWDKLCDDLPHKGLFGWKITALSPFVYLFLGFAFGWWSWAWAIIPVAGILESPVNKGHKVVALTPFIYVVGGLLLNWSMWWAWGWIIIPVSAILLHDVK